MDLTSKEEHFLSSRGNHFSLPWKEFLPPEAGKLPSASIKITKSKRKKLSYTD